MRNARLSPDGTHLAYIRPVNGRGHLVIQALSGQGRPAVVPPSEDVDIEWLRWANDDRVVFAVSAQRKRGLTETVETRLLASIATAATRRVSSNPSVNPGQE